MKTLTKRIGAAAIGAAVLLTTFVSSEAMPMPAVDAPQSVEAAQNVQYYRDGPRYRGDGYYRGHRGYRDRRDGYRYHNGYWYPLGAFAAGAIIGGALAAPTVEAAPRASSGINPRHYDWCAGRYRSYDRYSNTFIANGGRRQECLSPYY